MVAKEWFREWFNSPYYHLLYRDRNTEEAISCIEKLIELLHVPVNSKVLDVACGKGRHSKALAAKGFNVTGIDIAPSSIEEAKQFENDHLSFYVHDMRLPFWINYFDYAFNFFTSFGYFRTMRENNDALRSISQSLVMNGVFVIDYLNVKYVEFHLITREEKIINDVVFNIDRWYDEQHFFKRIHINDAKNNFDGVFTEQVEKFSPGDFTDMLSFQGLQVEHIFGDYDLSFYDEKKSERMMIVAKKIRV